MRAKNRTAAGLVLAFALVLALAPALPAAAFPRAGLELGAQGHRSHDGSYDLVGEDDGWDSFSTGLGVAVTPRLGLWLGYQYSGNHAALFDTDPFAAELTLHAPELSLIYAIELLPWLRPYARLGGGLVSARLDLELGRGEERSAWAHAPSYFLTGGVMLAPRFVRDLQLRETGLFSETTMGIRVEWGYLVVGELGYHEMAATEKPERDGVAVRRPDIDLGGLVLSGFTWKVALFAAF